MKNLAKLLAVVTLCLAPISAFAQTVIFQDDFGDALASRQKWTPTLDNNAVADGKLTINNTSVVGNVLYTARITEKPSSFTLSFTANSILDNKGGVFFCKQNGFNGYEITTKYDTVVVYKYVGGSGNSVLYKKCFDLNTNGNNKFIVSKSGNRFNVFVNDVFFDSFNDDTYDSGDISLHLKPNSSAIFDDIKLTDEFIQEVFRTEFSDNFDGNGLKYWSFFGNNGERNEENGVLRVNNSAEQNFRGVVDLKLGDEFSAKIETKFLSGNDASAYGIILEGEPKDNFRQIIYFAIRADTYFYITSGGKTTLESNPAIFGNFEGYTDKLEVRKNAGTPMYEFYANGELLAEYPADFDIIKIGIFADADLEIAFDNFYGGKEGSSVSIYNNNGTAKKSISSAASFAGIRNGQINLNLKAGNYTAELYNVQGRMISKVEISAINGVNATGLKTNNLSRGIFILNVRQNGVSILRHKLMVK
jgi:hypothetical protein